MNIVVGDARQLPYEDGFFTLTIGSPPYLKARTYGRNDMAMATGEWVSFMKQCTYESLRVTRGAVLWVVSGTGGENYLPGPELLVAELFLEGRCKILRPNIWTKNAAPTGNHWFSNDWEYVLAFANEVPLPVWNPMELATPLKYKAGGKFRQRRKDGKRVIGSSYPAHQMRKRPSNVHYVTVGGGHMGWSKATQVNEAPFPEALVSRFIRTLSNPGDRVLDPFSGSGTTPAAAEILGRLGYGVDLRADQVEASKPRQEYVDEVLRNISQE